MLQHVKILHYVSNMNVSKLQRLRNIIREKKWKNKIDMPEDASWCTITFCQLCGYWNSVLNSTLFLRTARSFYESLTYLLTYLLTYVQVIFDGSHPILKLTRQKMSEIIQVNVPNFFLFWRNPKIDQVRAKKPILGPKNLN